MTEILNWQLISSPITYFCLSPSSTSLYFFLSKKSKKFTFLSFFFRVFILFFPSQKIKEGALFLFFFFFLVLSLFLLFFWHSFEFLRCSLLFNVKRDQTTSLVYFRLLISVQWFQELVEDAWEDASVTPILRDDQISLQRRVCKMFGTISTLVTEGCADRVPYVKNSLKQVDMLHSYYYSVMYMLHPYYYGVIYKLRPYYNDDTSLLLFCFLFYLCTCRRSERARANCRKFQCVLLSIVVYYCLIVLYQLLN